MAQKSNKRTPAATPITRYTPSDKPFSFNMDTPDFERIEAHITSHISKPDSIVHEIISDQVHVDIHILQPSKKRKWLTLITSGMSYVPMKAPAGAEAFRFAELVMCLPPKWDVVNQEDKWYWPFILLQNLARFPHIQDAWIWQNHTLDLSKMQPPHPLVSQTKFSGVLIAPPVRVPPEFLALTIDDEKTIHFLSAVPLYPEEMDFSLEHGVDEMYNRFDRNGITELVDLRRPNVCRKS